MKKETGTLWYVWCHANIFKVRYTHPLEYLCVFVEVLGRPVLDVGLWGGLSQGEFGENATAGARHHIPGISTGFKLRTGSKVLRLTGEETERGGNTETERGNRKCHSSLCCCCRTFSGPRAESFSAQRELTGINTDVLIRQCPQGYFTATSNKESIYPVSWLK